MYAWTFAAMLVAGIAAYLLFSGFLKTYRLYRGMRVVTCPENHHAAAVRVAAFDAAKWFAISGETDLHLRSCSRWPEMSGCAEDCLAEIQQAPVSCLVQTIVSSWYGDKACHYCEEPIGAIVWHERPPAVRFPDGSTREWKDIRTEELPTVFANASAVCWRCNLTETFRREHGELVIERPRVQSPSHAIPPSVAVY
jgi:hypothetical protein